MKDYLYSVFKYLPLKSGLPGKSCKKIPTTLLLSFSSVCTVLVTKEFGDFVINYYFN
jgi:hypothetical protein